MPCTNGLAWTVVIFAALMVCDTARSEEPEVVIDPDPFSHTKKDVTVSNEWAIGFYEPEPCTEEGYSFIKVILASGNTGQRKISPHILVV